MQIPFFPLIKMHCAKEWRLPKYFSEGWKDTNHQTTKERGVGGNEGHRETLIKQVLTHIKLNQD